MKVFKKLFVVMVLSLMGSLSVAQDSFHAADVLRAAQENNARLLQTLRDVKNKAAFDSLRHGRHEEREKMNCVPRCSVRSSSNSRQAGNASLFALALRKKLTCQIADRQTTNSFRLP